MATKCRSVPAIRDLTATYALVAAAGARLGAESAVVDGEIVAFDESGRPSFQALQHRRRGRMERLVFYAFDLLHVDGEDLTTQELDKRKARLRPIIGGSGLLFSEDLTGSAAEVVAAIRGLGLEGVVAKRRGSRYQSGERSGDWVKLKLDRQQEFVVGGYRPGPDGVDALLVGV